MEGLRLDLLFPVLAAVGAGAAVGLEREFRGQQAGLRTHILVSLASAVLMLMSVEQPMWARNMSEDIVRIDPVRMAHGILTGIGFLCGGVIFRTGVSVHGLTTAASLWITSALGMLFGVGLYSLGAGATVLVIAVLAALRLFDDIVPQQSVAQLVIRFSRAEAPNGEALKKQLRELGIRNSTFTAKLTGGGEVAEFSANVRSSRWSQMERLLDHLREDSRVIEYELYPRKP
ncbi:MAG TPA: MgtC/SapB family protein [Caulobacteraceae bacterium]|nr:MgtC/SapB family protein [Caulobacteraceae bacterium]